MLAKVIKHSTTIYIGVKLSTKLSTKRGICEENNEYTKQTAFPHSIGGCGYPNAEGSDGHHTRHY
jgi:hypothetical protein